MTLLFNNQSFDVSDCQATADIITFSYADSMPLITEQQEIETISVGFY